MTIFIEGMPCQICSNPINNRKDAVVFSSFVANHLDPLYFFSGAMFHRSCFEQHPLGKEARRREDEVFQHIGPGKRKCVVCREEITDWRDHFNTTFFTDDPSSPASEFNYIHIHLSHYEQWNRVADFERAMVQFLTSDAWDGPQLKFDPLPEWFSPESDSNSS